MFENFQLARYQVTITAGKFGLSLPPYKGSTFRGGFGQVFRRITCSVRQAECGGCLLKEQCPYAYIFETSPPPDTQALSKYESIPRPFVLEPPLETKTSYASGESLIFHLVLIGRAIQYLPYFIVVFREMGEAGIGRDRRSFILDDITAIGFNEAQSIYSSRTNTVQNLDLAYSASQLMENLPANIKKIRIIFETPVRLKDGGIIVRRPEFHILFRQIMRRLSSLAYFHHGEKLLADYAGLSERACAISLLENSTSWHDWERYSQRQQQRMNMGGLVGTVTYEGNLSEFLPWLILGEQVHVGKNTVFGLGKYRIDVQ
ncbi:MAG: CRISPR system precrRNA processing endoribonuclease RAMP protein Cas6 [Dethiobacter sp.]|jgi:hypothetical protein|nr:MAG: CRISPR system precrRNA processing endoribonuclease RAMP protein Cas6 [Dethiobacter sp.]